MSLDIPMETRIDIDARDLKQTVEALRAKANSKRDESNRIQRESNRIQRQLEVLNAEARTLDEAADAMALRIEKLFREQQNKPAP